MPVFRIGAWSGNWKNKLSFWLMMAYMIGTDEIALHFAPSCAEWDVERRREV
jgi:hypothetical protein